jgi:peptidoglycan hydrolase CwlO-like protein
MSSADPEEVSVEIRREGVSVEKSFEPDDFPVPAIAFVIRSERDVPVDVALVDTVPEDIQAEDIGFHPKYGAEYWRNEGEELIFERTFEPGEEYTTVYGLRARDTEDIGRFLGEPEAEVDPPKDSSEVVRDVINEDSGGSDPGASADDLEAAIAAADVNEPTSRSEPRPEDQPAEPSEPASVPSESVAAALAESIRSGRVSDADLEVLRDALGGEVESSNSVEVRIDHLQSEIADLKAYSDALEGFIDENGEARTLVRELQETVEGVRADVEQVETEVESVSGEVSAATERVGELDEDVSRIDGEVGEVRTDVEDVESSLASVEERVEGIDEETTSLREEVEDLHGEVDGVRDEIPEGRIEELDDRMDELQDELEELAEMRKRMASVFGGMGGGEPTAAEDQEEDEGTDDADGE